MVAIPEDKVSITQWVDPVVCKQIDRQQSGRRSCCKRLEIHSFPVSFDWIAKQRLLLRGRGYGATKGTD
jgi:hypothetical protein